MKTSAAGVLIRTRPALPVQPLHGAILLPFHTALAKCPLSAGPQ